MKGESTMRCNKPVRCWDFLTRPCRLPEGHKPGCNPFSSEPSQAGKVQPVPAPAQKQNQLTASA